MVVGRINSDKKVEFYTKLFDYKNYIILRRHTNDPYRTYIYDNKERRLGVLPIMEDLEFEDLKRMVKIVNANWIKYPMVFFWANSPLVTEAGFPNYNELLEVYDQLVMVRRNDMKLNQYKELEVNILSMFILNIKLFIFRLKQKRLMRKVIKELKIIW